MTKKIFLFDMDGVLLIPGGYRESLKSSVKRVGMALGLPSSDLEDDHIAWFESLSITNEWDTLAICSALILLEIWQTHTEVRLNHLSPSTAVISDRSPQFDEFLESFSEIGSLPSVSAYEKIVQDHPGLDESQRSHLRNILFNARDIYRSPILWSHQETVLGSVAFQKNYQLEPQLESESYLLEYDRPALNPGEHQAFRRFLSDHGHLAGILTNRPSGTPPGYLSSPEAELGAKLVKMGDLPLLGSGVLGWFAVTHCQLPEYTFLKPNPVHALGLMQMCCAEPVQRALQLAFDLWQGAGDRNDWVKFDHCKLLVFEDSVKGLESGCHAQALLAHMGIDVELKLIGVSNNAIKQAALQAVADQVYGDINEIDWRRL